MSELNSRETAATVVEVITRLVERGISKAAATVHYGVVVNVTTDRKVDVLLLGQPIPSTGFVYGTAAPLVGDRVRCVIDPRGDRYIDDVLGRDAALSTTPDVAAASSVSLDSGTASSYVAREKLTADTAYRVSVGLDASSRGAVEFGNGASAPDASLSHGQYTGWVAVRPVGAGTEAVIQTFRAAGDANPTTIEGYVGGWGAPGIAFGVGGATPTDTRLYRGSAGVLKTDDTFVARNIAVGNVSITPVASTPTSVTVTGLAVSGTTLTCTTSAQSGLPGSAVTETSYSALSATGVAIYIYRTNTALTTVSYQIIGV